MANPSQTQKDTQILLRFNRKTGACTLTTDVDPELVIDIAKKVIGRQFKRHFPVMNHVDKVKTFLLLNMARYEREVFSVLFLDNRHRLIVYEELFFGSISHNAVNCREVVKRALELNAAALIVAHNHPSGHPKPSQQDRVMTQALSAALALVEVRLLDHMVVGGNQIVSMAEENLLGSVEP